MPRGLSVASLSTQIQKLVAERQRRADALAVVDRALDGIRSALGVTNSSPLAPSAPTAVAPARQAVAVASAAKAKKRRKHGKFATTGPESVLALVKQKGEPTTQEIHQLWKSQGRGGTSDNVLWQLVKQGVLKRMPLTGKPGSRYSLA